MSAIYDLNRPPRRAQRTRWREHLVRALHDELPLDTTVMISAARRVVHLRRVDPRAQSSASAFDHDDITWEDAEWR